MDNQDVLKMYFKEESKEKISEDFTLKVMNRVLLEPKFNSSTYQPLITNNGWIKILICALIFVSGLLFSYFLLSETATYPSWSFYKFDASIFSKPFSFLTQILIKIPTTYLIGVLLISFLLFMDQLYLKVFKR